MNSIVEALWLFVPAGIANATPVVANFIPGLKLWKTPIDINKSYRGKRILGNNKTWRGVVIGVLMVGLTGYIQYLLIPGLMPMLVQVLLAMSIGFGALYGDAVESFFKRQHNVESGESWFPFDQLDFIVGGLVAAIPYGVFGLGGSLAIVAGYFGAHLLVVFVFYHLGIRDRPI